MAVTVVSQWVLAVPRPEAAGAAPAHTADEMAKLRQMSRECAVATPPELQTAALAVIRQPAPVRAMKLLTGLAVTVSVLLGITMGATVSIPALLGLKDMVVLSGSMEPSIMTGDVVAIKVAATDLVNSGDVITFRSQTGPGMTTHRVIAKQVIEGRQYFQTKGDANASPDANLVPAEAVYGTVQWTVPKIGYLLEFVGTPWGKLALIIVPLFLLIGSELWDLGRCLNRPEAEAPGEAKMAAVQAEPTIAG